jgi:hypothetical protein
MLQNLMPSRLHMGADKFLSRQGMKQARKQVRDVRFQQHRDANCHQDFIFFQVKAPKEIHVILTETLACFIPVRLRTY